jgi:deoxyxylulose-5-phosphate synthase
MFSLTQAVQPTSYLQKLLDRCKNQRTRFMMLHTLCGFEGRHIVALGKITMSVTFGYVHNTRTEQVVFDIVDMEYPYNTIIG